MHSSDLDALTPPPEQQVRLPFVLMRGGTSKAVFLRDKDIPQDRGALDRLILTLFGSPDPRQIDGLGGADLLTSKLAMIGEPTMEGADLDYTFAQVSITEPTVDYDINCGNISSAVGAFAVDEGLVDVVEPTTTVRIHNTNTGRLLEAHVPIVGGMAAVEGDYTVHGVPGSGAPIGLNFAQTAGGATGSLLPTGNSVDVLDTAVGPVQVTIVDLANLTVFFSAESVGMIGTEGPYEVTQEQLDAVAAVKEATCLLLGMSTDKLTPVPAIVSAPQDYINFSTGEPIAASEVDLVARVVGGRPPVLHKAYPGTVGACTGVASMIEGSTVHSIVRKDRAEPNTIAIGHTSGVMPISASVEPSDDGWQVQEATYFRTARRLAEGTAFVRLNALSEDTPAT